MIPKVIIIFICLYSCQLFAQGEKVVISEKKTGKRIVLRAENKTTDTLHVFLMVHSEGYRRSADKAVVKMIAPGSKVPMITLIELRNVPSSYTYELIVTDKKKTAPNNGITVVDLENATKGKLVIFVLPNCVKCSRLTTKLTEERISYSTFDIAKNPLLYKQFMKYVETELTAETRIQFPIIWNKDHTVFGYDDLEEILGRLMD